MTELHDAAYYRRREAAERQLAEVSGDPLVAKIHLELAHRYAEQAGVAIEQPAVRGTS